MAPSTALAPEIPMQDHLVVEVAILKRDVSHLTSMVSDLRESVTSLSCKLQALNEKLQAFGDKLHIQISETQASIASAKIWSLLLYITFASTMLAAGSKAVFWLDARQASTMDRLADEIQQMRSEMHDQRNEVQQIRTEMRDNRSPR